MGENPIYPKILQRAGGDDISLAVGEAKGEVEFTSGWESVEGGLGVRCRTWKISGTEVDVDGADIIIEVGGHTPIQLVQAAEVVVDTPEEGVCCACVMDTDGQIYVNYFNDKQRGQMVWTKGMIICWIAETKVRLTEFESPSFTPEMFTTVPEDVTEFQGLPIVEYLRIVNDLRSKVKAE